MNYADKKGVEFVVMIGEDEMNSEKITVKDMKLGNQEQISISEFITKTVVFGAQGVFH